MFARPITYPLVILLACLVAACGREEAAPAAGAADASRSATTEPRVQARPLQRGNRIELEIDGESFVADTAAGYGLTGFGNGSHTMHLTVAWIGGNVVTMVELLIVDVGLDPGRAELRADEGPRIELANLPGRDKARWRSLDGHLERQLTRTDEGGLRAATGNFDARFGRLDDDGTLIEPAEILRIQGRFQVVPD